MKGWGTDEAVLIRLLAGLDGEDMAELCTTFESKYGRPLAAALKDELSGDFKRAALMWIRALQDPSDGLEAHALSVRVAREAAEQQRAPQLGLG